MILARTLVFVLGTGLVFKMIANLLLVALASLVNADYGPAPFNRNSPVYRDGSQLKIDGRNWTAQGANVYWYTGLALPNRKTALISG